MNRSLICILPSFLDYSGHEIEFINLLSSIAKKNYFKIRFILPKINNLKILASNKKVLFTDHNSNPVIKSFSIIKNYFILKKQFEQLKKKDLVYIDGYSFYFLISLIFYLLINRNLTKIIIWIRYPYKNKAKRYIFKFLIYLLTKSSTNNFIPITDNPKLAKELDKTFLIKTSHLPSLHKIEKIYIKNKKSSNSKINILCPGSYRNEKYGSNLINFLENNINNINLFVLNINKRFENFYKNISKLNIKFIKNNLDKSQYLKEINDCDIVILPYNSLDYSYRTSGIFFEAISMCKIVFVSSNTLMSEDLKKYHLKELIVNDWNDVSVKYLINIKNNKLIKKKLMKMKLSYAKIHSKNNFINQFSRLLSN
jgi:hypothetical protein